MAVNVVTSLCRLTVVADRNRVDLAVPVDMTVVDLLSTVVGGLGKQVADDGAAGSGWVLQQVGRPPLDPARSLAMEQVIDGTVLHLLPKSQQLPELAYDDVFETVGVGISQRTSRWSQEITRRASGAIAIAVLIAVWVLALTTGPDWLAPSLLLAALTVLLLLGCGALARAAGQPGSAVALGLLAVLYAAGTAAAALGGHRSLLHFGVVQLLPAAAAAVLAAAVCLVLASDGIGVFVAIICTGVLGAVGTGAADLVHLDDAANSAQLAASLMAVLTLVASPLAPMVAFRLSRLELPSVPVDAATLRGDDSRVDGPLVLEQAIRADRYLTGLTGGIAATLAIAAVILSTGGVSARLLAIVIALVCLLRARLFTGTGQRGSLLGAGAIATMTTLGTRAIEAAGTGKVLGYLAPAALAGLLLVVVTVMLPGRRLAPTWGRLADIAESLLVLTVIPLALSVMGIYGLIRSAG